MLLPLINFTKTPQALLSRVIAMVVFLCLSQTALASAPSTPPDSMLYYRVFLDDKEIGYHQVEFEQQEEALKVTTNAQFKVKFLIFSAYSYLHSAEEIWSQGCLISLQSNTVENRDKLFVQTAETNAGLNVTSNAQQTSLTGCIRSFAYWDKQHLNASRLLNSQTGEHVPAVLSEMGKTEVSIDGSTISAEQLQLSAEDAEINLWYSADQQWLALETTVNGRKLAYLRSDKPNPPTL